MSLAELADLAKLTISKPQESESIPTDGLWTSRNPVFLPPLPPPGQRDIPIPIPIHPTPFSLTGEGLGLCANGSGDVYLYGGFTRGPDNELQVYHYSATDNTVTPLQCWGACPGSRDKHAMCTVGKVIALHGGDFGGGGHNDPNLYLLNLVSHEWSRIPTSGHGPGPLSRHAMTVVGTTIYIFGGYNFRYEESNRLWAFNLDTLRTGEPTWELVEPSSQARPPARSQTTLVSYHDRLILFGGCGIEYLCDVWSFDTKSRSWSELRCTGSDIPLPRADHAAAMLDDVMYITGGYSCTHLGMNFMKDIFALKIPEQRWFKLENTDTSPVLRSNNTGTCIRTKIFIFGGDLVRGFPELSEHYIHILDAKYIKNSNLHTPERLKELDMNFLITPTTTKSEEIPRETESPKRSQIISYILENPSKVNSIAQLQRADTQMVVDFLADELGHQDILQSNSDRRHILHFLTKLAKSAQVFPRCTELSNVQCTLINPINDEGGYGFIYKGVFREQAVCVKAVRVVGYDSRPRKMSRAQAGEVVLLAHVSHTNVIPLYGAYLSSEEIPRICLVSPWMENGDLAAYLKKFPNAPKTLLMFDVAVGLNFLHDMGIIHADLKARNVLVSRSQRAMLADFGVSTVLHTDVGTTTAGDFAGTAYWIAPELLIADESSDDHHPPPTKQSDMWGFACICYEVLTGETPFIRHYKPMRLVMAFMKGHRITPLRPTRDSDPVIADGGPLMTLAEKCWNYDPSWRPTAAEALHFLAELNVHDDRPLMDEESASFEAAKGSGVSVEIDYDRILSIVQNVGFSYSGVKAQVDTSSL